MNETQNVYCGQCAYFMSCALRPRECEPTYAACKHYKDRKLRIRELEENMSRINAELNELMGMGESYQKAAEPAGELVSTSDNLPTIPSGYRLTGVNYECIWHSNMNGCLCTKVCPNGNRCWYPVPKTNDKVERGE